MGTNCCCLRHLPMVRNLGMDVEIHCIGDQSPSLWKALIQPFAAPGFPMRRHGVGSAPRWDHVPVPCPPSQGPSRPQVGWAPKPLTLLPAPVRDDGSPRLFCVHQWEMLVAQRWRCRMEPPWMGYGPVTPPCSPHSAPADQASGGDPPTDRQLSDGG